MKQCESTSCTIFEGFHCLLIFFVHARIVKVECQHGKQVVNEPVTHSLFARDSLLAIRNERLAEKKRQKNVKKKRKRKIGEPLSFVENYVETEMIVSRDNRGIIGRA